MASTDFENNLNAAIEEKGYRISPRMNLEDRLARYIQLSWFDRGETLNNDEIKAVAALMMIKSYEAELSKSENQSQNSQNDTQETQYKTYGPRRSTRLANRNIVAMNNDNLRITFSTGTHHMLRRSQVMHR